MTPLKCHSCRVKVGANYLQVKDPVAGGDVPVCLECFREGTYNCVTCGDPTLYQVREKQLRSGRGEAVCDEECQVKANQVKAPAPV